MADINNNEQVAIIAATTEASARVLESQLKNQLEIVRLQLEYDKEGRKDWMQLLSTVVPAAFAFFAEQMERERETRQEMQSDRHAHEVRMQEMKLKTAEAASGKGFKTAQEQGQEMMDELLGARKEKQTSRG